MKLIIAGGREFNDYDLLKKTVQEYLTHHFPEFPFVLSELEIVSGCQVGADKLGEAFATEFAIPIAPFPYLKQFGKAGGPIRNRQMAEHGTHAIVFWDGESRGSRNMIDEARSKGLPVTIIKYPKT